MGELIMNLTKRKQKVERLTNQALQDRQPHKYIQGRFLLAEIERREAWQKNQYVNYLNSIR